MAGQVSSWLGRHLERPALRLLFLPADAATQGRMLATDTKVCTFVPVSGRMCVEMVLKCGCAACARQWGNLALPHDEVR
jgi:hypothetical protein